LVLPESGQNDYFAAAKNKAIMKRHEINRNVMRRLKQKIGSIKIPGKILFIIMGVASTLWFLIRVIPKPQRAAYPCMRAAAPVM
jgi:hypothetical protein